MRAEELGEALSLPAGDVEKALRAIVDRGRLLEVRRGRVRIPPGDAGLTPARLKPRLAPNPGWRAGFLDGVDSTNLEAWRLVDRGDGPDGAMVIAEAQTAGRGRGENSWHSPPGAGLWFSVILRLDLPGERMALLTQMVGLQISLALEKLLGFRTLVKWPNDLHLDGRKVAGILTEARSQANKATVAVVGIGLNVNQEPGEFPGELSELATSLRQHAGWPLDRAKILDASLDGLAESRDCLAGSSLEKQDEQLAERSAILQRRVRIVGHGGEVTGEVVEQSLTGGLKLRTEGGKPVTYGGESIHSLDLL
jgi:BirA family biotin operon repressor/biotin-[acetyl-CoA-carboxylase] ligase